MGSELSQSERIAEVRRIFINFVEREFGQSKKEDAEFFISFEETTLVDDFMFLPFQSKFLFSKETFDVDFAGWDFEALLVLKMEQIAESLIEFFSILEMKN